MKGNLLFVDDEKPILRSLQRLFIDKPYDIFLAESGQEALQLLDSHLIDIIISDMRLPQMNGHELLKIVKNKFPNTVRVILSGYAQEFDIVKTLLDGSARMYLVKPWSNDELIRTIDNILEVRQMLTNSNLLSIINNSEQLPTLPAIYRQICELIDQDADLKDFTAVIEQDQSTTSRVLQVVNSAFVGVKTASVQHAISLLGINVLKDIVLSVSVIDTFGNSKHGLLFTSFWQHTTLTNKIVKLLAKRTLPTETSNLWSTAGLLHDIGKIMLLVNNRIQSNSLVNDDSCDYELEKIGITHEDLGGYLLDWWQFPYPMVEAALFHHTPLKPGIIYKELVCLVHIADHYSWRIMGGVCTPLEEEVFSIIKLSKEQCEALINKECR